MTIIASSAPWRIVTAEGEVLSVRVADGVDVQVGKPKRELVQAPFSSSVFLSDGDGEWQANEIDVDFQAFSSHPLDKFAARNLETVTHAALRTAVGLYGAGPYEGFYLPLRGALPNGAPLEGFEGHRVLPYTLIPASVQENTLYRGWQYPILDSVDVAQNVTVANESRPDAPVLTFRSSSRWSAPVPFARMPQGTFLLGHLFNSVGSFNLFSIGLPNEGAFSQSLSYDTGSFFARAGTGSLTVPQSAVGGLGYPIFWAMTFTENGQLRLYSFSRLGFQDHGSAVVGQIQPLATRRLYLGSTPSGSLAGQLFPGTPRFAAPALTHRVMEAGEIREALSGQYAYHSATPAFTEPSVPPGVTLTLSPVGEIVAGQSVQIVASVERQGGFTGELEFIFGPTDPSIRATAVRQDQDADDEDDDPVDEDDEVWNINISTSEDTPSADYTLTVTVRAVGWTSTGSLKTVIDEGDLVFPVVSLPVAPDASAKSRHVFYSPQAYDLNTFKRDSVGVGSYPFNLRGLGRWSIRGDAAYFDGTDIAPYGKTYGDVDDLISMADSHGRAVGLWNAASAPFGAVFAAFASKTVKGDYWYLYRGQSGLQVKLAGGGGTNLTDTPSLPVVDGVMHVAVRFDKATNKLYLSNTKTKAEVFTTGRAWSGNGLFTAHAMKQSDNTVSLLTKGTLLYQVGFPSLPNPVQLEREAAYQETFMLRTAAWAREEWADGTDYIFEAIGGEIYRNRHPATAGTVPNLTATNSPVTTGDSWKTSGAVSPNSIVYTPVLNRGIQAANDAVFAMRDFKGTATGDNVVRLSMTAQNSSALYIRAYRAATSTARRAMSMIAPGGNLTQVQSPTELTAGDHSYSLRYTGGKAEFEDIDTGEVLSGSPTVPDSITGNLVYATGGLKRQDSTSGTQFLALTECKGFVLGAKLWTSAERKSNARNLQNVFDYSGAPAGGVVGNAPTITSFTASPTSLNAGSSATLTWATSGTVTSLSISGIGTVTGTSTTVSPTTTTTYTLTASNGSSSSTAQVTVVVNGTGGGTGGTVDPGAFAALSAQALPSYSNTALYPTGSQARGFSDILDKSLDLSIKTLLGNLGGQKCMPRQWDGTETMWRANANRTDEWTRVGNYYTGRGANLAYDMLCWNWRVHKNPLWLNKIADFAEFDLAQQDFRGSAENKGDYRSFTPARIATLGTIDASVASETSRGKRIMLNDACGIGGRMHAAYILWVNRDKAARYAMLSHRLRCMFVMHNQVNWDQYWDGRGQLYSSDTTRKYPERVRRGFIHADTNEWMALMYWGLLETNIFNSNGGLNLTVSVPMTGWEHSTEQYSGTMVAKNPSYSLSLHSSTSANKSTHDGTTGAVLAFQNWYNSRSRLTAPASRIINTELKNANPDGVEIYAHFNRGSGKDGSFGGFQQHPVNYSDETDPHWFSLYQEGIITAGLGSQVNAEAFMKRMAGSRAVGAYAEMPDNGKLIGHMFGILNTTNAAGAAVTIHRYTDNSDFGTGSTSSVTDTKIGTNPDKPEYRAYEASGTVLYNPTMLWAAWDTSGFIGRGMTKLRSVNSTGVANGTFSGIAAMSLALLILKNGRGSSA